MSGLVNVSEVVLDPLFAIAFQIVRFSGGFVAEGEYHRGNGIFLNRVGCIQPASQNDIIEFLPEGERDGKFIKVYCSQEIMISDGQGQESDEIIHHNFRYRVTFTKRFQDYGYWFAICEDTGLEFDYLVDDFGNILTDELGNFLIGQ